MQPELPEKLKLSQRSYFRPLCCALGLHLLLLVYLLLYAAHAPQEGQKVSLPQAHPSKKQSPQATVVQAVTLNSQQVMAQVKAIKKQQQAAQRQQQRQLQRLQSQVKDIQAKRHKAQKSLLQLKQQQQRANQQLQASQQQAKRLQQQQAAAQAKLKQQQQAATKAKRAAALKAKQEAAQQAKKKAEQQAKAAALRSQQQAALLQQYKTRILAVIASHWLVPANLTKDLACQLAVRLATDGSVLHVKLLRSSGNSLLDRSARLAVLKASPLPVPKDPVLFQQFRELHLTVRPQDLLKS